MSILFPFVVKSLSYLVSSGQETISQEALFVHTVRMLEGAFPHPCLRSILPPPPTHTKKTYDQQSRTTHCYQSEMVIKRSQLKLKEENFSLLLGCEPWSPGTKSLFATNGVLFGLDGFFRIPRKYFNL